MPAIMQAAVEMQTEHEEIQKSDETRIEQNSEASSAENSSEIENAPSELEIQRWSLVTFEGVAMSGLRYEEAMEWTKKLYEQKISGLCIVTDEAAARMSK